MKQFLLCMCKRSRWQRAACCAMMAVCYPRRVVCKRQASAALGTCCRPYPETNAEMEDDAVFAHRLNPARNLLSQTRPMPECMGMRGAGDGMGQCPAAYARRDGACSGDRSGDNRRRRTHQHRRGRQRPAALGTETRGSAAERVEHGGRPGSEHHCVPGRYRSRSTITEVSPCHPMA